MEKIKRDNTQINNEVNQRLLDAAKSDSDELLAKYQSSLDGLDNTIIDKNRDTFGKNIITPKKKDTNLKRFIRAFTDPFTLVLFVLAVISYITDVVMEPVGQKDASSVVIIVVLIAISGMLQFIQESRSKQAAEQLSALVKTTILVRRKDGGEKELPNAEVVSGDIIVLAAGDMIPADIRILKAKDLFVAQSSLTGESEPVEKFASLNNPESKTALEMDDLAFMGSNVVSGSAIGVTINVGDSTLFGTIAKDVSDNKPKTSFEKGLDSVSWVLIRLMLVMVPIVFVLGGFRSGDWTNAFLFALSVAVGLTPAMLPTIVSTNLAKGALALSKKKVIVKNINSIQNFGGIDILCTDKTGTLTQDKVVLMNAFDINGKESEMVLQYGFLNSNYQTGLKNLMDLAIINYSEKHDDITAWKQYQKVDEIPFDFSRRRMSVIVKDQQEKEILITKGAIEEMLAISSFLCVNGKEEPLTKDMRTQIINRANEYNENGLRVLGLAYKEESIKSGIFSIEDEKDLVFLGYLSFLDPPKESAKDAIQGLNNYGVKVKILTGDNDFVTQAVCEQVGISVDKILLGSEIESLSDNELDKQVEKVDVFAKLSPQQKARIIKRLRSLGHTLGYMGDGINDASAMKQADVGISVDTAVDIAKESANIILLEKNLMVLQNGIIEGRKTYANIIKYIKMTLSSNFGNIFSVVIASIFLPFLPILPLQLLVLNLIYDISCIAIPWDNVDPEFLKEPKQWDSSSITKFMVHLGPTSSVFDVSTFTVLFFVICPMLCGGAYHTLSADNQLLFAAYFHTGWFIESLWTQTLVIHMIRTPKIPFIQSRASNQMILFTSMGILVGTLLPYTFLGPILNMEPLPMIFYAVLIATIFCYIVLVTIVKRHYVKKNGELL